jgi:hypothetical protein
MRTNPAAIEAYPGWEALSNLPPPAVHADGASDRADRAMVNTFQTLFDGQSGGAADRPSGAHK